MKQRMLPEMNMITKSTRNANLQIETELNQGFEDLNVFNGSIPGAALSEQSLQMPTPAPRRKSRIPSNIQK